MVGDYVRYRSFSFLGIYTSAPFARRAWPFPWARVGTRIFAGVSNPLARPSRIGRCVPFPPGPPRPQACPFLVRPSRVRKCPFPVRPPSRVRRHSCPFPVRPPFRVRRCPFPARPSSRVRMSRVSPSHSSPLPTLACPSARMPFPLPMPARPSAFVPTPARSSFTLPTPGHSHWNAREWLPSGPHVLEDYKYIYIYCI
jgi:hypothetical protein